MCQLLTASDLPEPKGLIVSDRVQEDGVGE